MSSNLQRFGGVGMNRFKFWRWGRLRRLGRPLYILFFTIVWVIINVGLGIYREITVLGWTWEEVFSFQSQMILFVILSGAMIGWFTWDIGDDDLKVTIHNHILDTDRLILRRMTQVDFKAELNLLSDQKTMSFWPSPFTKDDVRSWILRTMESYSHNGFGRYIVQRKSDGAIIGDVGFLLTEVNGLNEVDLGYIIHSNYWGQGYATEAARACLEYGINELKIQRIVANMPKEHLASEQIAKKIGMIKTGEFNNNKNQNIRTNLYVMDTVLKEKK